MRVFIIITISLVNIWAKVSGDCPDGWTRYGDYCYWVSRHKLDWLAAQEACEAKQANLASGKTHQESTYIHAFVTEFNFGTHDNLWIGLNDILREGDWIWRDTKQQVQYDNWAPGEPNQSSSKEQDCVELYGKENHLWADADCGKINSFICQKTLHGVNVPVKPVFG